MSSNPQVNINKQKAFSFKVYKRHFGLIAGLMILFAILNVNFEGLSIEGQRCLALSLMTVMFWATGVAHPGFTSLLMLMGYVLMGVAPVDKVFAIWTSPLMYLVVGGFLIAAAVQASGLGKRIAYKFILKFVDSFSSVIVSCYVLGFLLSFLIPHPWPRSFLIMSVMAFIIKAADLPAKDAANIGFAVFAGSASTSMILLTGDSVLNIAAVGFSGQSLSWLEWLWYMGIPGLITSIITCVLQLKLFRPTVEFKFNKEEVKKQLDELGSMTGVEKKTLLWVSIAIILWATDSIHHVSTAWVALGIAIILSFPVVGDILKPPAWGSVNIGTLFFLTAALAIGKVGAYTGMNEWIASVVLPETVPTNPFVFAALASVVTVVLHMVLGSALAVMGIASPALVGYASTAGINPLIPALIVYTAVAMHWILPFHHMNLLVGLGKENGQYGEAEAIKLGIPLTIVVFIITVLIEIPWWKVTGLM